MKVTINLTKQEAIEALLQFYKHTGASEIVISDDEASTEASSDDGWISNIGRDSYDYPDSLYANTRIKVKYRNGETVTGYAAEWVQNWKETNGYLRNIVAYRILKD